MTDPRGSGHEPSPTGQQPIVVRLEEDVRGELAAYRSVFDLEDVDGAEQGGLSQGGASLDRDADWWTREW
jgi:hypothetical protein